MSRHNLEQHCVQYHETSLIISEKERRSETIPSNEIIPSLLSFLSQDFSGSAGQRSSKRKEGKEPPLEARERKENGRLEVAKVCKGTKKERGSLLSTTFAAPVFQIRIK